MTLRGAVECRRGCRCRCDRAQALNAAANSRTAAAELGRLSRCADPDMGAVLAANPSLPRRTLRRVARRGNAAARVAAAAAHSLNPGTFKRLAADHEATVRAAVAANSAAPDRILETLSDDSDPFVRVAAVTNPAAPAAVLEQRAEHPNPAVRLLAATNVAAPPEVLDGLADDDDPDVAAAASEHPFAAIGAAAPDADPEPGPAGTFAGGCDAQQDNSVETFYRASDGTDFMFRIKPHGRGWRAVVPHPPNYRGRNIYEGATHLYEMHTAEPYVCWSETIHTPRQAIEVAAIWAESTIGYISTGRFAPPQHRPEVEILEGTPLARFLSRHEC